MITYVIPTRNRPRRLLDTLRRLSRLDAHAGAEVIVVDNASDERVFLPTALESGVPVREIRLRRNEGAAARNHGVAMASARSEWIVMLDDDSYPLDSSFIRCLAAMPQNVGAVSADISLVKKVGHDHVRESGGLPEVFIGCGVAIRRRLFLDVAGYDHAFQYYVEEYDLAAKLLMRGYEVRFEPSFRVRHAKDTTNRNMDLILERLVRNNCWIAQRYAPEPARLDEIRETRRRYRAIAAKEHAMEGFARGLAEARRTVRAQLRTPMNDATWARFTGLAAARDALGQAHARRGFKTAVLVDEGKNAWAVRQALEELGVRIVGYGEPAEAEVIATLSPGPMLDAWARRMLFKRASGVRLLAPWRIASALARRLRQAA